MSSPIPNPRITVLQPKTYRVHDSSELDYAFIFQPADDKLAHLKHGFLLLYNFSSLFWLR